MSTTTTLTAALTAAGTALTVADTSDFPDPQFYLLVDSEVMVAVGPITGTSIPVARAAQPTIVYCLDTFMRTIVGAGWGTADIGGVWSGRAAPAANYNVGGGIGSVLLTAAGDNGTIKMQDIGALNAETLFRFRADTTPLATIGYIRTGAYLRHIDNNNRYRCRVRASDTLAMAVELSSEVAGVTTVLAGPTTVARETYAVNTWFWCRFRVEGTPTATLSVKFWRDGTAEPTAWDLTVTDASAALQLPGGMAIYSATAATGPAMTTISYADLATQSLPANASHLNGATVLLLPDSILGTQATDTLVWGQLIVGAPQGAAIHLDPGAEANLPLLMVKGSPAWTGASGVLFPRSAAAPTVPTPVDGMVYYDTTTNKLRIRAAGIWVDLH